MIQERTFTTDFGEIPISIMSKNSNSDRKLALIIRGAFAPKDQMEKFPSIIPDFDFAFGDIPGNGTPKLIAESVGLFAAAYSAVIQQLQRNVVICGVSLGGLVGLAARAPNLTGVLALDPPLRPMDAPRLLEGLSRFQHTSPELLWSIFGLSDKGTEFRDYMPIVSNRTCPTVILAADPSPRTDGRIPGTISDETLREIRQTPGILCRRLFGVGHDLGYGATDQIVEAFRSLLEARAQ